MNSHEVQVSHHLGGRVADLATTGPFWGPTQQGSYGVT